MSDVVKIAEFYSRSAAPWPVNVAVSVTTPPYSSVILDITSGDIETKTHLTIGAAQALIESLQTAVDGRSTRYSDLNWLFKDGVVIPWAENDSDEVVGEES